MTMPCGHPVQAIVTNPEEGTSYCAVCEGQAFACESPEQAWIADSAQNAEIRAQFVLVDVGCIECGESTEVPAVFSDEGEAREAFMALCAKIGKEPQLDYGWPLYLGYFTGGQRSLELHRVGAADANPNGEARR